MVPSDRTYGSGVWYFLRAPPALHETMLRSLRTDGDDLAVRPIVAAALLAVASLSAPAVSGAPSTNGFIVVLRERIGIATPATRGLAQSSLAHRHGIPVEQHFRHTLNGFVTRLTPAQHARLAADPRVDAIEPDHHEQVLDGPEWSTTPSSTTEALAAQAASTGQFVDDSLRRIKADQVLLSGQNGVDSERPDIDIAILDSGIAPLSDLNIAGGYNCTGTNRGAYSDKYGHGTEVAAVAAAKDNNEGIVGLLPGARLWAVKMITNSGWTSSSMAICALDWVAGRRDPANSARPLIEVANMSFTIRSGAKSPVDDGNCGKTSGDLLHRAICRMTERGTIGVAAAGNHGRKVGKNRPAAFRQVLTVSAIADFDGRPGGHAPFDEDCLPEERDKDDTFANFSNYGPAIDITAPGVCMTMPWIRTGGTLHQQSGTSFAAPLVAAAAGFYLTRYPKATPKQVRNALINGATGKWFKSTDPDGYRDRLLNVANLAAPAK